MSLIDKLRYRILNRAIKQFVAEKNGCRMPDIEKLSSAIIILDDIDKQMADAAVALRNAAKLQERDLAERHIATLKVLAEQL